MKATVVFITTALLSLCSAKLSNRLVQRGEEVIFVHESGNEIPSAEAYSSGLVHMTLMEQIARDIFDLPLYNLSAITEHTPCVNGFSSLGKETKHTYSCKNLDLYSFTPHDVMGSDVKIGNDIWGWSHTDETTKVVREFGLIGQQDGTAFVEILDNGQAVYLGRLPTQSVNDLWRDIKVIGNYAYIGSEAEGHGIQVFDLTKLLESSLSKSPKTFSIKTDLTGYYDKLPIGSSHNVVAHETKNLIVAVGSRPRNDTCRSGLIFVDVSDPTNPQSAGCAGEDGYVHDAQCLTYYGPHAEFVGTDVCYSFNENTFTIYNITTPSNPLIISRTFYYGVSYSHQGWVTDEKDQRYLLLDDELDELQERGWAIWGNTTTYIWDIQDLRNPVLTGHYNSPTRAIDHNLYVVDGLAYESNYLSGLRVVNVSSVNEDPTGAGFYETAFFDVHPEDDEVGGLIKFGGAWSAYPYFISGYVLVNSMERGLFVLKLTV